MNLDRAQVEAIDPHGMLGDVLSSRSSWATLSGGRSRPGCAPVTAPRASSSAAWEGS